MYTDTNGFDFTWSTVFDIVSISLIVDSMFPEFRSFPIIERTNKKGFVPRKDSRKKANLHKKVDLEKEILDIQMERNTIKQLREIESPKEMELITYQ